MKKLLALTLAALMVFGMVACASNTDSTPADTSAPADSQTTEQADASTEADASSESTEQADAPAETLIFGTSADYAPFEFMYPDDNGDMVYGGIDVSVAQYIADYTGKTLQTENMAFDYLLASLQKGDFDIVIAAMEATDERKEAADFSDPYYYEARRVVVRADDDSIHSPEDLNGKKIATNTTNAFIPWYEENGAEVVGIDTSAEAIDLVLSGRADFLGISVPVLNAYLDEHPDAADKLKAAFVIPNSEDVIAIPVRKGEPEFLDAINAALAELREEGTLKEISEKYLGGDYTNSAYSN